MHHSSGGGLINESGIRVEHYLRYYELITFKITSKTSTTIFENVTYKIWMSKNYILNLQYSRGKWRLLFFDKGWKKKINSENKWVQKPSKKCLRFISSCVTTKSIGVKSCQFTKKKLAQNFAHKHHKSKFNYSKHSQIYINIPYLLLLKRITFNQTYTQHTYFLSAKITKNKNFISQHY